MDSLPVNITDIVVGLVLLVSALFAFARGFVHEVLSVAGWIGAIFASIYGVPLVKDRAIELMASIPNLPDWVPPDFVAPILAGSALFLITLVVLAMITRAVSKTIQASAFNALDRSLGFLFGLLRGAVLICLAYIAVDWLYPLTEEPAAGVAAGEVEAEAEADAEADAEERPDRPQWLLSARSLPLVRKGAEMLVLLVPMEGIGAGAEKVRQNTEKLMETQKALEGIIAPATKGAPPPAPGEYDPKARQGMQKLIESTK